MTVTTTTPCPRCEGSGVYRGTRRDGSTYEGACFACQGGGPRYRRTRRFSPSGPAFESTGQPVTPVTVGYHGAPLAALPPSDAQWTQRQRANVAAFAAANPAAYAWLIANRGTMDFAASLLSGCARYGGLTPRQLAAVERNLARAPVAVVPLAVAPPVDSLAVAVAAGQTLSQHLAAMPSDSEIGFIDPIPAADPVPVVTVAPPVVAPVLVGLDRVRSAMESARASGLRKVRLDFGDVSMRFSGPSFRSGNGMILCYHGGGYRGYVDAANVWHARGGTVTDTHTLAAFRLIGADPQAAARTHGQATSHCSCCRRLLTDPVSVMANIGPVCARRFGWSF